jgi:excisionase family DNA binding protein
MGNVNIPVSEKYSLTIEEAAAYFRIGENKLRRFVEENRNAKWVLRNGNRMQIKRRQFEILLDETSTI